jgi:hypothetical protein
MEWVFFLIVFVSGYWIATNWSKVIWVRKSVVHVRDNYDNHCWNCKTIIHASQEDNVWYGHKRCKQCNYFICNHCGSCFCKSPYTFGSQPLVHKWVQAGNAAPMRIDYKSGKVITNNQEQWINPNITLILWRQFEPEPDDLNTALLLPG